MIRSGSAADSIAACASCISSGGLLGLPTETVYGLAADADNDAAVVQIFKAKGRPADHPLIVHVVDASAVAHFAVDVPDFAQNLMSAFWPGPLTLILPRRPGVATAAAGGNPTIGLRCPSHPLALALLKNLMSEGLVWGLAAPSANQFGCVSPTTAEHVASEFGEDLLILDGGACSVGIESSIIDCTRGQPVLLRPGAITRAQVQAVCGFTVLLKEELPTTAAQAPKASGTLESHYAPKARVRLLEARAIQAKAPGVVGLAVWSRSQLECSEKGQWWRAMPLGADTAAQQLFAVLREFDAQGASQIWIETPPDGTEWDGVRDRLQRAAS